MMMMMMNANLMGLPLKNLKLKKRRKDNKMLMKKEGDTRKNLMEFPLMELKRKDNMMFVDMMDMMDKMNLMELPLKN